MGLTAPHLHPTDHQGRAEAAQKLLDTLASNNQGHVRAACGEGLGLMLAGVAAGLTDQVWLEPCVALHAKPHTMHEQLRYELQSVICCRHVLLHMVSRQRVPGHSRQLLSELLKSH